MGFDFGTKRIGVAVGQELTATAEALETVKVHQGRVDWAAIEQLVNTWQPHCFVVGDPRCATAGDHPLAPALLKFSRRLEGRFHRRVYFTDEALSSFEAEQRGANDTRFGLDAVAAQIILETWLVRERHAGTPR